MGNAHRFGVRFDVEVESDSQRRVTRRCAADRSGELHEARYVGLGYLRKRRRLRARQTVLQRGMLPLPSSDVEG
jgi:hypothetical protein